jgi:hypothetical protein
LSRYSDAYLGMRDCRKGLSSSAAFPPKILVPIKSALNERIQTLFLPASSGKQKITNHFFQDDDPVISPM